MTVTASPASAWQRHAFTALCLGIAFQAWGCRFGRAPGDGLGDYPASAPDGLFSSERAPELQPSAADTLGMLPAGARAPGTSVGSAGASGSSSPSTIRPAPSPTEPAADSCNERAAIEGCDPISNSGCLAELGMQCDVDLLAATPTGACVFSAPAPDANSCLAIFPTQSCPPQRTCVDGTCLKICLCDSDCDAAEHCMLPLAASGFKACAAR